MYTKSIMISALFVVLAALILDSQVEARYLPTRANGDRIDKLRELLTEVSKIYRLLESEIEKEERGDVPRWHPESKLFYKREADAPQAPAQ
ncbi:hypothetical protein NQ318_016567 [Aromia moschata]|uniref:Uncharacterized protein n=1 Tax=Aromia moschata TaxID=1265417 RepID=A0AAV8YWZ4_9CUCU|nr:hypothetical protein NQ318_016567 [Aromia moschata]